jgi:predicted secreted acid phosphatase
MLNNNPRVVYGFYFLLLLVATFFAWLKLGHAQTPMQPQVQSNLKEYYESGKYYEEIATKVAEVQDYISKQSPLSRYQQRAIVLDIDETSLSNYQTLKRLSFTRNEQALTAAYMLSKGDAIPSVLSLYQYAINHKIAVFFISERIDSPEIRKATMDNLVSAGFSQWQELILMPIEEQQNVENFKTKARQKIAMQGFDILANIGDQESDISGGYAEIKVKLPNPFYGLS